MSQRNRMWWWSRALACLVALTVSGVGAMSQAAIQVYVGYADNLRPSPFFPNPWQGSPNTVFVGSGGATDAGAIRVDNTGALPISVDAITIDMPWIGLFGFSLWGSNPLLSAQSLIVTQTTQYNFDTSDFGPTQPTGVPLPDGETAHATVVHVTVDGVTSTFLDTGHVLTTGGFDLANLNNSNESLQWRLIGTTGVTDPGGSNGNVPEPASWAIFGLGAVGLAVWRRRRK